MRWWLMIGILKTQFGCHGGAAWTLETSKPEMCEVPLPSEGGHQRGARCAGFPARSHAAMRRRSGSGGAVKNVLWETGDSSRN